MQLKVGTQSWSYEEWNGVFYDASTPGPQQLKAYAEEFAFVEVDATFYGTPPETTIARWREQTPDSFCFAPKMPREITHKRAFSDCEELAEIFFRRILELGPKLGPVLVQLPPTLDASVSDTLIRLLARRPDGVQCAIEMRHKSWFTHGIFGACEDIGIAIAAVDAPFIPPAFAKRTLERTTADFAYLRLLGTRDETLGFDERVMDRTPELELWAEQIRSLDIARCYITTSNFYEGFAPETARIMQSLLQLPVKRRPRIEQTSFFSSPF